MNVFPEGGRIMSTDILEKLKDDGKQCPHLVRIELYEYPDGKTLVVTPSGKSYCIETDAHTLEQFLQLCDGNKSIEEILSYMPDPEGFSEVIDMLTKEGCLSTSEIFQGEQDWIRFNTSSLEPRKIASYNIILIGDERLISIVQKWKIIDKFHTVTSTTQQVLETQLRPEEYHSTVIIALREHFDYDFLVWLNDFCDTRSIKWTQFHLDQGRGWLGPFIVPSFTSDYRDVLGRRLTAMRDPDYFKALTSPLLRRNPYLPPDQELVWMLSSFLIDIERWLAGASTITKWYEVEADPVSLKLVRHPVLPLPHKKLPCTRADIFSGEDMQQIIDKRTGIITQVVKIFHHPSIPSQLKTAQSYVADINQLYPWANNTFCGGSTFGDFEEARNAAIGEGIERYCGNWVPTTGVVKATYNELIARGEHPVDPEKVILYSESQYNTPGFPFTPFTRNLGIHWVQGHSLTKERAAWLPANIVYVNWHTGPFEKDIPINSHFYPGLAAGPTLEFAIAAGIQEIIERHATMVWWLNHQPLPAVILTPDLTSLWKGTPESLGQRAWLIYLENEFKVPVMAGVVENVKEQLFSIGFAARPDPKSAALKAWTEALTLQENSRVFLEQNGRYRQEVASGQINGRFMKPWRADRRYLDDYRTDFRDVGELACQQQIFLDPRAREVIRPWVDVKATLNFDDLPMLANYSIESYSKPLEALGYEIFYTEVTTPDVALTGMRVVRVVVPGLVPNFPAGFPFLGRNKIQEVAVELGWRSTPLAERELNYFPMPHA